MAAAVQIIQQAMIWEISSILKKLEIATTKADHKLQVCDEGLEELKEKVRIITKKAYALDENATVNQVESLSKELSSINDEFQAIMGAISIMFDDISFIDLVEEFKTQR